MAGKVLIVTILHSTLRTFVSLLLQMDTLKMFVHVTLNTKVFSTLLTLVLDTLVYILPVSYQTWLTAVALVALDTTEWPHFGVDNSMPGQASKRSEAFSTLFAYMLSHYAPLNPLLHHVGNRFPFPG